MGVVGFYAHQGKIQWFKFRAGWANFGGRDSDTLTDWGYDSWHSPLVPGSPTRKSSENDGLLGGDDVGFWDCRV